MEKFSDKFNKKYPYDTKYLCERLSNEGICISLDDMVDISIPKDIESLSEQEQIRILKEQVANISDKLSRTMHIIDTFQNVVNDYLDYYDECINKLSMDLHKHTNGFHHSMLIVGNKEKINNESDIS